MTLRTLTATALLLCGLQVNAAQEVGLIVAM